MVSMSCLTIIRSARDNMSANEKKLADFVLENASLIRDYSSQQIAGSVGVSQSSVVKFSQKLGYKGFTDLKLAVHESVVKQESNVSVLRADEEGFDEEQPIKDLLLARKYEVLKSATVINDNDAVLAAVRAIESAVQVQVIGADGAGLVAKDLAHKLIELGKPVIAESDRDVQLSAIANLGSDDCLVVISATGQAAHLVESVKSARKSGAVVVSITNQWANPLGAISDVQLYSVSSGDSPDVTKLIVATSQQHLVDLLYCSLEQRSKSSSKAAVLNKRKGHRS
jgi:DNA-binding MurR/RpiR family transcriptional regulator